MKIEKSFVKWVLLGDHRFLIGARIFCNERLFFNFSGVVVIPDGDVFSQIIGKIAEPTYSIAEIAIVAVTCSHFQIANRSTTNRSDHLQSSLRKKSLADYPGRKSAEEFFLRSKILRKLF